MAIRKLLTNNLLIDNVPNTPSPEDTADNEPVDLQNSDLTCNHGPTRTMAHQEAVGVQNVEGQVHGKVTALCNKH